MQYVRRFNGRYTVVGRGFSIFCLVGFEDSSVEILPCDVKERGRERFFPDDIGVVSSGGIKGVIPVLEGIFKRDADIAAVRIDRHSMHYLFCPFQGDAAGVGSGDITGADARGILTAGRGNGSAADGDITGIFSGNSAANARSATSAGSGNGTAVNDDITAAGVITAADARAILTAGRGNGSAVNDDLAAGLPTAADTCGIVTAGRGDGTAVDGNSAAVAGFTAADSCGICCKFATESPACIRKRVIF